MTASKFASAVAAAVVATAGGGATAQEHYRHSGSNYQLRTDNDQYMGRMRVECATGPDRIIMYTVDPRNSEIRPIIMPTEFLRKDRYGEYFYTDPYGYASYLAVFGAEGYGVDKRVTDLRNQFWSLAAQDRIPYMSAPTGASYVARQRGTQTPLSNGEVDLFFTPGGAITGESAVAFCDATRFEAPRYRPR